MPTAELCLPVTTASNTFQTSRSSKHHDQPISASPRNKDKHRVRSYSHNALTRPSSPPHLHHPPSPMFLGAHSSNSSHQNPGSDLSRSNSTAISTARTESVMLTPLTSSLNLRSSHTRLCHAPPTTASTLPLLFQYSLGAERPRRCSQDMRRLRQHCCAWSICPAVES